MERFDIVFLAWLLGLAMTLVVGAGEAEERALIHKEAVRTAGVLGLEWLPDLPVVAIPADEDAAEPLLIASASGTLIVTAESRAGDVSTIVLARSTDGGRSWDEAREIARAGDGKRVTAGAGGVLSCGRLVLAVHEWSEKPGKVTWVREDPRGVHHYAWKGFQRASTLNVLVSDDSGGTWQSARVSGEPGPIATSGMGRILTVGKTAWLAVHGPADRAEMDAALSSVGLMRSDDDGASWRFSHWVARADRQRGIAYGPGGIALLPDGRWLGMLEGYLRNRGDHTKPRVCRTVSHDGGRTWSSPEIKMIGPASSLIVLDTDRVMVGSSTTSAGVSFNVFVEAGRSLRYQDHAWRGFRTHGGLRLVKRSDGAVLGAYAWKKMGSSRTEIHLQTLHSKASSDAGAGTPSRDPGAREPKFRWEMAEARQLPDMAEAPAGLRMRSLMKLGSGDWTCIGYGGTTEGAGLSYGFGASGLAVMRAPAIEGPWKKVVDLPVPEEVGGVHDPGTGMGMPSFLWQHSSGRLFLPFSAKGRVDVCLTCSDDEGRTWHTIGSMAQITGLPDIREADAMVEAGDGSVVFPMVTGAGGPPGDPSAGAHLLYVRSADGGRTWSKPHYWGRWPTYPPAHYESLTHGHAGDIRETALAIASDRIWLGIYRQNFGAPIPVVFSPSRGEYEDYVNYGSLVVSRSEDAGRTWKSSFGMLVGMEPALAATPDGAVFCAHRQLDHGSVWISYDHGRSWQVQEDPVELPWGRSAGQHGQWPPGGESTIRVLDEETVVVITDTGIVPSGKPLPEGFRAGKELRGRAQVRFFRRVSLSEGGDR